MAFLDLDEALNEVGFQQQEIWDVALYFARKQRVRHKPKMKSTRIVEGRAVTVARACKVYAAKYPERVQASQRAHAKKKWRKIQADPARLEAKRAYQRAWLKAKGAKVEPMKQSKRRG